MQDRHKIIAYALGSVLSLGVGGVSAYYTCRSLMNDGKGFAYPAGIAVTSAAVGHVTGKRGKELIRREKINSLYSR